MTFITPFLGPLTGHNEPYSESMLSYLQRNAAAMRNSTPSADSLLGLINSYQPTAHDKDRWLRSRLGIPSVSEDVQ